MFLNKEYDHNIDALKAYCFFKLEVNVLEDNKNSFSDNHCESSFNSFFFKQNPFTTLFPAVIK